MTYYSDEALPALSDEQWARLQAYGSAQEVESGALLGWPCQFLFPQTTLAAAKRFSEQGPGSCCRAV